jgi:hypothetical protein
MDADAMYVVTAATSFSCASSPASDPEPDRDDLTRRGIGTICRRPIKNNPYNLFVVPIEIVINLRLST